MYKQFKEKKEKLREKQRRELLNKYGGDQHFDMPDDLKANMKVEQEDIEEFLDTIY